EAAAARALGAEPGSAEEMAELEAADALHRGPYLEGLSEPWVVGRRRELGRLHLRVLRRLVERLVEAGPSERAIELASRLARLSPRSAAACQRYVSALI